MGCARRGKNMADEFDDQSKGNGEESWERKSDWRRYAKGERYPNGEKVRQGSRASGGMVTVPSGGVPRNSGLVMAVALIALGVLFFLSNLGLLRMHDIFAYWPVILIVVGLTKLSKTPGMPGSLHGIMFIVIGCVFLMVNLGLFSIHGRMLWPLILVGVGVLMLSRSIAQRDAFAMNAHDDTHPNEGDPDSVLQEWAIFGGVKRVLDTPDFKGGHLMACFGGIEIDLRRAQIIPRDRPVMLDVNAAFGGVNVKVPDTWRVAVRGVGVFGGYEDKTLRARRAESTAPQLVITGYAAFGGVVVE